jgi:hypothetical protein
MYAWSKEVGKAKEAYEATAMNAVTSRLDYLYNYAKETNVDAKKAEYVKARDDYRKLKAEYENVLAVPDAWQRTGITLDMLQKATVKLPVDGKTSAFQILRDMEERLWKVKYVVPKTGVQPPLEDVWWFSE